MEEPFPPPSSPETSPAILSECMEEILKFILSSFIDETLESHLELSKEYCFQLLLEDGNDHNRDHFTDFDISPPREGRGVPLYPLYKSLASALNHYLTSGVFDVKKSTMPFQQHQDSFHQKLESWNKLVQDKGSDLIRMLNTVEFQLHVQDPFFNQLRVGLKTVEGRCAIGDYIRIQPGALLLFNKCLLLEVQDVKRYASFSEMLEAETLQSVLPGVKTIKEGVQIYRNFYTEEKENSNGVIAICVSKSFSQPYITLSSIVSGLGYEGVGSLLGLMNTVGTVPDALPPPRSALLSSLLMPHKPDVNRSTLTEGARALAKHVERASSRWWGCFDGNDSTKNKLAARVVSDLISHCCWINIHVVQPHGDVFEIRVTEGYGARWTKDGSKKEKASREVFAYSHQIMLHDPSHQDVLALDVPGASLFIGFVEPYMHDGHLKGWKQ